MRPGEVFLVIAMFCDLGYVILQGKADPPLHTVLLLVAQIFLLLGWEVAQRELRRVKRDGGR